MRLLAAALLFGAVAGCGGDDAVDPLGFAVDAPGPFNTGYTTWQVTYQPPGGAPERTISINVWYPTEDTDGYAPVYEGLFRDNDSFEDATPAAPLYGGTYPVHVYSHGFRGFGGTSAFLMRYFASHGWVAVAPSHTDNLLFDEDPIPTSHYFERSTDISVALDELANAGLPGEPATDAVLLSGHSFGAFTVWASAGAAFDETTVRDRCTSGELPGGTCSDAEIDALLAGLGDDRVVAALPMAGGNSGWFGDDGYSAVDVPVFYMSGTEDQVGQQALFDLVTGVDLTWIDVEGGCHQLFGLGGCFGVEDEVGFPIVSTYALAFARHHVLADGDETVLGILAGDVEVSDLVHYAHK